MMRLTKRALSAFLAFVMVFTMLPLGVWAEGSQTSGNMVSVADSYEKASDNQTLELDNASTVIAVGGTHTFNASLKSEDGTSTPLGGSACQWTSSKNEVATVEDGVVTGVGVGTTQITCTYGELETFAMVTVTEANYRLVYQSNYPEDAVKYTYQNGGSASIGSATDTTVNETYEIGATATVASGIFTTINYDLDGDGSGSGAGTAKPEGYKTVNDMLSRAKELSKEVIDDAEANGTYALWQECDSLSYYYLFNIDDKGGNICNFKGAGKNTNKEFIFFKKYDYDLNRGGVNLTHTVITWQATNISASFGESFLCRNGLPIRISYTGNMADAQNNPQFFGYGEFASEFRNRDYRFVGCAFLPDRVTWSSRPEDNRQCTELGKPYPDPVYPQSNDVRNENDPAYSSPYLITRPTLRNNSTHANYGSRKYLPEGANRPQNTESADYPLIRLAEVYLIYAEATCELNNGSISNEDLNYSINKTRARAGVAPLTNELIANVWDAGYFDHATGHTICKKMTMLDEIRRERACELFGEGFRLDDLKRWGIAHINLTGQKLGRHVLNTAYTKYTANDLNYFGQPCYDPDNSPLLYGLYEGSGPNDPDYGRSIATLASNLLFEKREYLAPIPLAQIRLNPQLTQNPGW